MLLDRADIEWLLANAQSLQHHVELNLRGADLHGVKLDHLDLSYAHLERARLIRVDLTGAKLVGAHLQGADLTEACLKQTDLRGAQLSGARLYETRMDADTRIDKAQFGDNQYGFVCVENTRWEGMNLTVLDWTHLPVLGDERKAQRGKTYLRYRAAVHANRQFATVLRDQGLNEEADNFAYRGQRLKRDIITLSVLRAIVRQQEYRWVLRPVFYLHRKDRYQLLVAMLLLLMCSLITSPIFNIQSRIGLYWGLVLLLTLTLSTVFVLVRPILQLVVMLLLPLYLVVILLAFLWVIQVEFSSLGHVTSSVVLLDTLFAITPFAVVLTFVFAILARRQGSFARLLDLLGRRGDILYAMLQSYFKLLGHTLSDCGKIGFSLFLDRLAGYGYKPGRSVVCYLVVIRGFAIMYAFTSDLPFFPDAIVFSIASFHGRGFFPSLDQTITLHHPLIIFASLEAIIGLLIEVSFIATFTQRFFGR